MLHAMSEVTFSSKFSLFLFVYVMNSCWLFLPFPDIYAREFDESLMSSISLVYYEDDVENLPPSPDVSNYVIIEVSLVRTLSLLMYCTDIWPYLQYAI